MAKLPVLMYHNFTLDVTKSNGLTISAEKFERQLNYLTKNNYQFLWSSDLESLEKNSKKSVVLTFDDVTQNQMDIALPLLKKYQAKATFFVPFAYLGATDLWNKGKNYQNQKIMTAEQLQSLDANLIQLAHHSYQHCKYSEMSEQEINDDFENASKVILHHNLNIFPALAYPYGNYPKKDTHSKSIFFKTLEKQGIKIAFRIGNRLNETPKNTSQYEWQRIDVKGEFSLLKFKWLLKFGKLF